MNAQPVAATVSRKIVTVVFADLIGSVSLHERLDAESARRLMDRYHRAMTAAVEVHGGRVVQLLGDGVLAAFGVPRVAEDDAIRAVRAAVGMQRTFRELARDAGAAMQGVGLRVAVNTGEIVVGDDENSVMGDPTNVAARLQQEARDGDVIVGEGTQRLVGEAVTLAPLGSFALRGRTETVAAYRVVSLDRATSQQAIAFVGRDEELRRLVSVYESAAATPAARLVVLLGSPGLGKSRLVAEFTRRAGERATVLSARCDAAGGATFAPLAEALRTLLRIDQGAGGDVLRAAIDSVVPGDDAERTRIAAGIDALLAGTPAPPEETFFVVRRLLGALAAVRPVVLVIDDLHWAEPLLLDLIEHLVQWSSGVPLLILVAARPELRDTRSSLATPGPGVADVVTLGGLDASAATRLAANVIGGAELPAALAGRVLATSEGNPLFVAELVRMLVQDGTLVREGERWITTVEISKLDMPPTIQVLLAARIERLRPEERAVLERAAVIGRHFSRAGVAHLLPRGTADLDARLEALRRSELIEPDTGWFLGEPALRFHHVLIRDAAYRRVLKETRAELHERVADWITSRAPDAVEHDETIGWHLEQAHQNLRELGALDDRGRSLGERASQHLGAAGRRALAREDLALAAGLLGRAIDRLDPADPARADLALEWCEALLAGGDVTPATRALGELARFTPDSERLRAWHTCFAGQLAALTDPQSLRATASSVAQAAESLAAAGDAAGEAKAHAVHASALSRLGEVGACETALDKALAAARRARDRRRANAVLAGAPIAALWGPSPVTRASGRCLDVVRVLRITQGAPTVEAVALRCQAVLETLRGRGDAARRMIAASRRMVEELGIAQQLYEADVFAGLIEMLEGDAEAAEQWLRSAYDGLRERGLGIDAARAAALLGRALLAQGRAAEAEALSHESEALAGDDLKAAIAWRGVRAEALAKRGETEPAVELARTAVAIASTTDALLDHADARMALATALRAGGHADEATAEETRAIELWETKGATLLTGRVSRPDAAADAPASDAPFSRDRARAARPPVRPNAATERVTRTEWFDADREAAALARFDELTGEIPSPPIGNAATRTARAVVDAMRAQRIDRLEDLFAEDLRSLSHETGVEMTRDEMLVRARYAIEHGVELRFDLIPVAALGEHLALYRMHGGSRAIADAELPVGETEIRALTLGEIAADGRLRRLEHFPESKPERALTRLYELWAETAPEAERARAGMVARAVAALVRPPDLDALAPVLAPEMECADHRMFGMGTARGAKQYLSALRTLLEATQDLCNRDEILAADASTLVVRREGSGTLREGGGIFVQSLILLRAFGADGRITHIELFDTDREADALSRRAELVAGPPAEPFGNAAWRAICASNRAWRERRWDDVVAAYQPDYELVDRRSVTGIDLRGGDFLGNLRLIFDMPGSEWHTELLATRGERHALVRARLVAELPDRGSVEWEHLGVTEYDMQGRRISMLLFDTQRLDAAYAELDACYHAGEAATHPSVAGGMRDFSQAFAARDWDALAARCAPEIAVRDHRRLGWETLHGPAVYVQALRALVDLAPDTVMRLDHVEICERGYLVATVWSGTRDGGVFEEPSLMVAELDAAGRIHGFDQYELERLDEARVRYASIAAPASRNPLRIPPNAATRADERWGALIAAGDWDGLRELFAPDLVWEDRRRVVGSSGDRDALLANVRLIADARFSAVSNRRLSTSGERLSLTQGLFRGPNADAPIEIEILQLIEVDERGRITAVIQFDGSDRRGAAVEMLERYMRGEGARQMPAPQIAFLRAMQARDLAGMRAALDPNSSFVDHRRTGMGYVGNAEDYLASLAALIDETDEFATDVLYHVAIAEHGSLSVGRMFGTLRGGGGFESVFVRLNRYEDGRSIGAELYELEDLDRAKERFQELGRAHGKRRHSSAEIAPSAVLRAMERFVEFIAARDWNAFASLLADDFEFDDRRAGIGMTGEKATMIASVRLASESGAKATAETLAIAGDRLALQRIRFSNDGGDRVLWEIEVLQVVEIDASDRFVAAVTFDAENRVAGEAELRARFERGGEERPAPNAAWHVWTHLVAIVETRDWTALRAYAAPGFVFEDRRRRSLVRGDIEVYVRNLEFVRSWSGRRVGRALLATAGDRLALERLTYTADLEGSAFEGEFLRLTELDADGKLQGIIHFDVSDRDAALVDLRSRFQHE